MVNRSFFPPTTLAGMEAVQLSSLVDTAVVRSRTLVSDNAGGFTEVVTFTTGLPVRVTKSHLLRGEELVAGQLQGTIPSIITFEVGIDLQKSDRINVNGTLVDTEIVGGTLYEVIEEYQPQSYSTASAYLCIERG